MNANGRKFHSARRPFKILMATNKQSLCNEVASISIIKLKSCNEVDLKVHSEDVKYFIISIYMFSRQSYVRCMLKLVINWVKVSSPFLMIMIN